MSDDDILKIWEARADKADPKTQSLLNLMYMFAKAMDMASEAKNTYEMAGTMLKRATRAALNDCKRELSKIEMQDKIEFVRCMMRPMARYNLELKSDLDAMGTDVAHEVNVNLVSRATREITASNVPMAQYQHFPSMFPTPETLVWDGLLEQLLLA
ncbi:hypothetical protein IFR05_005298 [Cadophora sp. M221]|nr:hypothetical protein IFR05_005298 [Cadophora sp. M221]